MFCLLIGNNYENTAKLHTHVVFVDDDNSHAGHSTLAIFMFSLYMMMAHILLLNLLIATFT